MNDRTVFLDSHDVPRETIAALDTYASLLADWQQRMNLVGASTLPQLWHRHFADSAQLLPLAGDGKSWLDIGAGAGFPGLVIALLDRSARVTLVESIGKKCVFLQEVAEQCGVAERVTIANYRVETLAPARFDVIAARACAALDRLFEWGLRFARPDTRWILPKGARFAEEIDVARQRFRFDATLVPSRTDPGARIIVATGVGRR